MGAVSTQLQEWLPRGAPWAELLDLWEPAEVALARFDQAVLMSPVREAWLVRHRYEEAVASLWLEGETLGSSGVEDLVLYEQGFAGVRGSLGLLRALAMKRGLEAIERRGAGRVLTLDGLLALVDRRRGGQEEKIDEDRNTPLRQWLDGMAFLAKAPALPASAVLLAGWERLTPFDGAEVDLGRLLAVTYLRMRGKVRSPALPLNQGLRDLPRRYNARAPLKLWLKQYFQAIVAGSEIGLRELGRLAILKKRMERAAEKRRSHSKLHVAVDYLLRSPWVTIPGVAHALGLSQRGAALLLEPLIEAGHLRKIGGGARYRIYALG